MESGDDLYGSGDALYYWMWPNTMLNIVPGRLQTNRMIPKGVDSCRVEFDFYYSMDESDEAAARRLADLNFSDEVQFEDLTICEDVQRGWPRAPTNPAASTRCARTPCTTSTNCCARFIAKPASDARRALVRHHAQRQV